MRERVKRGAAFLDRHLPGWAARVDPGSIEQQDYYRCVLGQLHGTFGQGLDWMDACEKNSDANEAEDYGFSLWNVDKVAWAELTALWREQVGARGAAGG